MHSMHPRVVRLPANQSNENTWHCIALQHIHLIPTLFSCFSAAHSFDRDATTLVHVRTPTTTRATLECPRISHQQHQHTQSHTHTKCCNSATHRWDKSNKKHYFVFGYSLFSFVLFFSPNPLLFGPVLDLPLVPRSNTPTHKRTRVIVFSFCCFVLVVLSME